MQRFFSRLLESPLFKLHLLGQSAPLYIRKQERLDQILDKGFVVVVPSLKAFQMLVHLLLPQIGHDAGLTVRSPFHSVVDDPVQISIDCSLVHLHDLFVEALLTRPNYVLSVSPTSLLDLPVPSLVFCALHLLLDLLLLGSPH